MITLDSTIVWLIIFLKFFIPITIVFTPFFGGWSNFILDSIDGDLLIPLGLTDSIYQAVDKTADWFTYVGMVLATRQFKWKIKRWVYALFILRTLGQIAFFTLKDERVFFLFPNFLEPLFLIYATIVFFKKARAENFYLKHRAVIWIFVILYKLQDEWITHIGNIDRTEWVRRILS